MATLLLRLHAPLQSWGTASRYTTRFTGSLPSKSGVIGLLAAALGRERTEPVADLAALRFAVRTDQAGVREKDFQTIRKYKQQEALYVKTVEYLADYVFVVALEGEREFLEELASALERPYFPLYLGHRWGPPSGQLLLGVVDEPLLEALRAVPWQAFPWYKEHLRKSSFKETFPLRIHRDGLPGEQGQRVEDVPLSFASQRRLYGARTVMEDEPRLVKLEGVVLRQPAPRALGPLAPRSGDEFMALGAVVGPLGQKKEEEDGHE